MRVSMVISALLVSVLFSSVFAEGEASFDGDGRSQIIMEETLKGDRSSGLPDMNLTVRMRPVTQAEIVKMKKEVLASEDSQRALLKNGWLIGEPGCSSYGSYIVKNGEEFCGIMSQWMIQRGFPFGLRVKSDDGSEGSDQDLDDMLQLVHILLGADPAGKSKTARILADKDILFAHGWNLTRKEKLFGGLVEEGLVARMGSTRVEVSNEDTLLRIISDLKAIKERPVVIEGVQFIQTN